MKKLLLLGGSRYLLPVIKEAHKMGIFVITCDYLPDNIAHKYSDKYYNISIVDKEAVLKMAKEEQIDGVLAYSCDPGVVTAAYVAEMMSLPNSGPYESICILQDKERFRDFLSQNGFNVPKSKGYIDKESVFVDIDNIEYPVIVKPVDSAGSKGVTCVSSQDKLSEAVDIAFEFSISKKIIIEQFLNIKGFHSTSDCFSVDGKFEFLTFGDHRYDKKAKNSFAPISCSWPSTMSISNQKYLSDELQRLISLLHLTTSVYNIETCVDENDVPYIMEVSPRTGGNRITEVLSMACQDNLIKKIIQYAVQGEKVSFKNLQCAGFWAEIGLFSRVSGKLIDLSISDDIANNIKDMDIDIKKGDLVRAFNGANDAIGNMILCFDSHDDMSNVLDNIENYVHVNVEA